MVGYNTKGKNLKVIARVLILYPTQFLSNPLQVVLSRLGVTQSHFDIRKPVVLDVSQDPCHYVKRSFPRNQFVTEGVTQGVGGTHMLNYIMSYYNIIIFVFCLLIWLLAHLRPSPVICKTALKLRRLFQNIDRVLA